MSAPDGRALRGGRPAPRSRTVIAAGAALAFVGLATVLEVAIRYGTGPQHVRPDLDALQGAAGASLLAVGAGMLSIALATTARRRIVVVVALGSIGVLICVGLRWLTLAVFGIDPGFRMDTYEPFAWSLTARLVLFPALGHLGVALIGVAAVAGVVTVVGAIRRRAVGSRRSSLAP